MGYLAVDKDGKELYFDRMPVRHRGEWILSEEDLKDVREFQKGFIKRFFAVDLKWEDEPLLIHI